jgi:hypothetical protein
MKKIVIILLAICAAALFATAAYIGVSNCNGKNPFNDREYSDWTENY